MKKLFVLLLFLMPVQIFAQTTVHKESIEKTVKLESGELDTLIIQFTPSSKHSGWSNKSFIYNTLYIDSLASDALPYANWTARNVTWDGHAEFDIYLVNTDLATDSLSMAVYALDRNGNVRSNEVAYLKIATFPGYSTTAYYNAWTTATSYRAHVTGIFGEGTFGLLVVVNPNDDTASKKGTFRLRAYIY